MIQNPRFLACLKVNEETGCWNWVGTHSRGYGQFYYAGKYKLAHRVAWRLEHGHWPEHQINHLCENKLCVNPEHLEDVTAKEHAKFTFRPEAIRGRKLCKDCKANGVVYSEFFGACPHGETGWGLTP